MDIFLLELGGQGAAEIPAHRARVARALDHLADHVLPQRLALRERIEPDFRLTGLHFPGDGGLLSWAADADRLAVLCGEAEPGDAAALLRAAARRPAEAVIEEMVAGEGRFGAVLLERASGRVRLFGDALGGRALRYATGRCGRLAISSHDIGLMISGLATAEVDETTLASMMRHEGWALGGRGLFAGVATCAPGTVVTLTPEPPPQGNHAAETRILRFRPPAGPSLEHAIGHLARRLAGQDRVRVELSAGLDSRASLAAALAVVPAAAITVYTEGPEASRDVQVARAIAADLGLRFEHGQVPPPDFADLLPNWSQSTLATNGQTDISVLASRRLPAPGAAPPCTVSGDGGESFRGSFYPYRLFGRLRGLPRGLSAEALIAAKILAEIHRLPEAQRAPVRRRLGQAVARLEAAGLSRTRVFDMFFAQEDIGLWNQQLFRCPALRDRVSPFCSTLALRAALAGPEPMGWRDHLHHALIARHLPQTLDIPLNGEAPPRLLRGGVAADLGLELHILGGKLRRRLRRWTGRAEPTLTGTRYAALIGMLEGWHASDAARAFLPDRPGLVDAADGVAAAVAARGDTVFLELGALRHIRICADIAALCRVAALTGVAATCGAPDPAARGEGAAPARPGHPAPDGI